MRQWHLLPHVARYVAADGRAPSARFWRLRAAALESRGGLLNVATWSAVSHRGEEPFRLEGVELVLFGVGVGVTTIISSSGVGSGLGEAGGACVGAGVGCKAAAGSAFSVRQASSTRRSSTIKAAMRILLFVRSTSVRIY